MKNVNLFQNKKQMKKSYLLIQLFILISFQVAIAKGRYANSVIIYSSQISSQDRSANQVLGAPSLPLYTFNSPLAWSSETPDGRREYLELGFLNPFPASSITIYEKFNAGAIDTIYFKNPNTGKWEKVWSGTAKAEPTGRLERRFTPLITPVTFNVSEVRLAINSPAVKGWNLIDAVALWNTEDIPDLLFSYPLASYPLPKDTNVLPMDTFKFIFNEPIRLFTINLTPEFPYDFYIYYSATKDTITCIYHDYFLKNHTYQLNFSALNYYNDLASSFHLCFKTKDTSVADLIPPRLSLHNNCYSPETGSLEIKKDSMLAIQFSEAIQIGTGSIYIKENNIARQNIPVLFGANIIVSGNKVSIMPLVDFTPGAKIDIQIGAGTFKDLAGNDFAGNETNPWRFTVKNLSSGMQEIYDNSYFNIYPNPVNDNRVVIQCNDTQLIESIELFDMMGNKKMKSNDPLLFKNKNSIECQFGALEAGVYFISLKTSSGLVTKKVIISN